ncbi:TPA_exp: Endopolyphosphatase [Trichophyton benhamiae CBS 112371]|uniref:Endopolyphosphatase n=1 Tax=Arthroderma benhamiae (strain ATCC MYA-4681 / CBS 112371) TaxID=663331 RepID=D4B625_ARTBC|nr:vacuolar endopolyphosphatase, putative [Trichophyton benhamiae CBS 112371]EFE29213.1 vacuolar endopolyphosphatase, putative [Trichophyton benhamiae CBS 112371]DAA72503.1 TPA_exp: Endopolyphosphatase [Trichophyton benhamiae CBS 112371]
MAPCLLRFLLLLLTAVGADAAALNVQDQAQVPLVTAVDEADNVQGEGHSGLHGRFLHITDIHADLFYKAHTKIKNDCHRGHGIAGFFGTPGTDCDAPETLLDATFDWIGNNLRDKVDFVIWTGDAARHDKDERRPRSEKEIVSTNRLVFDKFVKTFHKPKDELGNTLKVPIIPTFGNNDIMPHNIMERGPNKWTRIFSELWGAVIPEEQRHSFAIGGWFYVEAIPEKLAVISLNTMYFYRANSAVDGCNSKYEPGFEHMEWLRTHLQLLRDRGMKAILIGHVPPAQNKKKKNWSGSCWQKYAIWMKQYRDVVVGSFYGHMNLDHFILQDFDDIKYIIGDESEYDTSHEKSGKDVSITVSMGYLRKLKKLWSKLPQPPWAEQDQANTAGYKKELKKYYNEVGGPWAERYFMSIVSPSVIPNFFPSIRVVEYNISGIEHSKKWPQPPYLSPNQDNTPLPYLDEDDRDDDNDQDNTSIDISKKHKKRKKHKKKYPKFTVPNPPSRTSPPGPAYSNQPLSLLGYQQYFANLTELNQAHDEKSLELSNVDVTKKSTAPKDFYQLEYDTRTDPYYQLPDMTMNSYLELARRIAREEEVPVHDNEKSSDGDSPSILKRTVSLWTVFRQRAFIGFFNARMP